MVNYYYVKANCQEWTYPKENGKPTDWENFPINKEQDFGTFTKNMLYWKNLKKGDLIIGHSSYMSSNIIDKLGNSKLKFTPRPRISAIAVVLAEEHLSQTLGTDAVTLKKVIELESMPITKEFIAENKLGTLEPFRLGTNRCTITRLTKDDFEKIINLLEKNNLRLKKQLKQKY